MCDWIVFRKNFEKEICIWTFKQKPKTKKAAAIYHLVFGILTNHILNLILFFFCWLAIFFSNGQNFKSIFPFANFPFISFNKKQKISLNFFKKSSKIYKKKFQSVVVNVVFYLLMMIINLQ